MPKSLDQATVLRSTIATCLNLDDPKSVFLFAGAGAGKTRAIVDAMREFRNEYGQTLRDSGKRVAIITYTKAASEEIISRMDFDTIFAVSTIHSFAWEQIRPFSTEIKESLRTSLISEIETIREKQRTGRSGTKAAVEREIQIEAKQKRLERLQKTKQFTYNPNGENIGKNSLNHSEVISILAKFLAESELMRKLLIQKHPVLLIDESQDTQKNLIDSFFMLQSLHSKTFSLMLFGDTMQRIYADGKVGLEDSIPTDWATPAISVNHRCPKRVIQLINKIRATADDHQQTAAEGTQEGVVRVFVIEDHDDLDKTGTESEIAAMMAAATSDELWHNRQEVKTLTLEHHMAAKRAKFINFFEPLHRIAKFKTGLLDGSLRGIGFMSKQLAPLVKALRTGNRFAVARITRSFSPLLLAANLESSSKPIEDISKARDATLSLLRLWDNDADPSIVEVLKSVSNSRLLEVPDIFAPILHFSEAEQSREDTADINPEIDAWRKALQVPYSQFESYVEYIADRSPFGTHQGIKGLQFPRVMVIIDDNEARGFMFSYEKLLGVKTPTSTDLKNQTEGKETSLQRTQRLLYVTCSRAQQSLALVVYTREVSTTIESLKAKEWFNDDEISLVSSKVTAG